MDNTCYKLRFKIPLKKTMEVIKAFFRGFLCIIIVFYIAVLKLYSFI